MGWSIKLVTGYQMNYLESILTLKAGRFIYVTSALKIRAASILVSRSQIEV